MEGVKPPRVEAPVSWTSIVEKADDRLMIFSLVLPRTKITSFPESKSEKLGKSKKKPNVEKSSK